MQALPTPTPLATRRPRSALVGLTALICACSSQEHEPTGSDFGYVEESSCATCHPDQTASWTGSHHDLAMQVASESTVLGDFNDAIFEDSGVTTRFFKRADDYFIQTEGPDGGAVEFKVAYTFGVEPLQQYLIEFPGGRLQALTVAWDAIASRWYDLYPDQRIATDDPLHWTGRLQTWNTMCAECHSTGLVKGYDAESDTFDTSWERIDVGCQACHGPGEGHIRWAESGEGGDDLGLTVSLHRGELSEQLNSCAPCHSRRSTLTEEAAFGGELLDLYSPSRIQAGLYHADGQIQEEVYVYGSFLQSLMSQRGVTCTDCHDAHGLGLHVQGNAVCTQCHAPTAPLERFSTLKAKQYDTPEHHFHPQGTPGASCVNCHMPTRTYMGIDERRDHSIRIPRPDLSEELGTPNACNECHTDKTSRWAAEAVERWYGPRSDVESFVERFARASTAEELLSLGNDAEAPSILRASSLERIAAAQLQDHSRLPLSDPDPLIRASALRALSAAPPAERLTLAAPLLDDELRSVRIEAARLLAPFPTEALPPDGAELQADALEEYIAAQTLASDTPGARLNLALLWQDLRRPDEAVADYRRALELDPYFLPAHFNLATLLNVMGRNPEAEAVLREGILRAPDEGDLHFSLSLLLAESGKMEAASASLERAAALLPERARVHYNLGLTLQHLNRRPEAEAALLRALVLDSAHPDFIHALAVFYMQGADWGRAEHYARLLFEAVPEDPGARELLQRVLDEVAAQQAAPSER